MFFFLMIPRHPRSTLFPYTTLFRSSRFRREVMYKTAMFSGPRFQAIHSIETWGEDGQIGTLRSLSTNDLFRSVSERSEEHTSELQSQSNLVCRLLLEKKKKKITQKQ